MLPEDYSTDVGAAVVKQRLQMRVCEDMGYGLHAMAQPLTVLRGAIGSLILRGGADPNINRYLEMSNQQVERLCDILFGLQSLIDVVQFDAANAELNLREMMNALLDSYESKFKEFGVKVIASKYDSQVHAFGDPARTKQAILAVFDAVLAISSHGDVVEVEVMPRDSFVNISFNSKSNYSKSLGSGERLQLSLAKANILSQQGRYQCVESPFCVSMCLPMHHQQNRNAQGPPI